MNRFLKYFLISQLISLAITLILSLFVYFPNGTVLESDCGPPPVIDCGFDPVSDYRRVKTAGFPFTAVKHISKQVYDTGSIGTHEVKSIEIQPAGLALNYLVVSVLSALIVITIGKYAYTRD